MFLRSSSFREYYPGNYKAGAHECKAVGSPPRVVTNALSRQPALAQQALQELLTRSKRSYVSGYVIAAVYAAMGDKDQAFTELQQAYLQRSFFLIFIRLDPALDSLRPDPRFRDMVRRMNFLN